MKTTLRNRIALIDRLRALGFTLDEAEALRRIEMTLHRWAELECGDGNAHCSWAIERDEETGKPYQVIYPHDGPSRRRPTADKEQGALKRLAAIMAKHPTLTYYHQTDPRGCALYVVEKPEIIEEDGETLGAWLNCNYTRGVAVAA